MDLQRLLLSFLQKHKGLIASVTETTDVLQLYEIDQHTALELFLLLNEQASLLVVQNSIPQAELLIEHALVLCSLVPLKLQSALFSNMSCLFERQNNMQMAKLYFDEAHKLMA